MNLVEMNAMVLSELLGREISDAIVLVAKNMILGNSEEGVSEILGCSIQEVKDLVESQDYKDSRLIMASHHNAGTTHTDLSYDDIEQKALQRLQSRIDRVTEVDQLVRIATMANRATRRHQVSRNQDALDPNSAGRSVQLTLTKRFIKQLSSTESVEETQRIDITDRGVNPTFDQVDEFFGVRNAAKIQDNYMPESGRDTVEPLTLENLADQVRRELEK